MVKPDTGRRISQNQAHAAAIGGGAARLRSRRIQRLLAVGELRGYCSQIRQPRATSPRTIRRSTTTRTVVREFLVERPDVANCHRHIDLHALVALAPGTRRAPFCIHPCGHARPAPARRMRVPSGSASGTFDHLKTRLGFRSAGRSPANRERQRAPRANAVEIVDLGDGAERRARVLRRGLLLDRNCR